MYSKLSCLGSAFAIAASVTAPAEAQRPQLSAEPSVRIAHEPTQPRWRFDPVQGAMVEYAVDGAIDPARDGTFLVSWNGRDGSRQRAVWDPPNRLRAEVAADVTFDPESGLYVYSYVVTNHLSSDQALRSFYIEARDVMAAESPDGPWYSRAMSRFLQGQLGIEGWRWSRVLDATGGVAPGDSAAGFSITSRVGPGVVRTFVAGYRRPLEAQEEIPEELMAALDEAYFRFPSGVTVGPDAAPTASEASQFEDVLRVLLDEASDHGWLGGPESSAPIRGLLLQVAAARAEGNGTEVRRLLDSLDRRFAQGEYRDVLREGRSLLRVLGGLQSG